MRSFKKRELTFSRKLCVDPDDPTSLTRTQHPAAHRCTQRGHQSHPERERTQREQDITIQRQKDHYN